ncbi:MAG: 2-amino-4-hydroxy-6-hydroxymethyldihydropteridine diphosphokinase, partial [SAR324 cluster bacterium]|nr:2-amino-4-hydroxy-6-hydroxymethyldihydropteridine diphosphokinase [SAR324 cluster bacterium]
KQACVELESLPLLQFRVSPIYESEPLLKMPQPKYLNMVVCGLTELSPLELLKKCQQIENRLGRVLNEHWGSRTIDIDILTYGEECIDAEILKIPHPEIEKRSFVLVPLLELSPEWVHPKTGISIRKLWEERLQTNDEELPQPLNWKSQSN